MTSVRAHARRGTRGVRQHMRQTHPQSHVESVGGYYLPYQTTEDLIVTALEGGSNYWYFLPDLSMVPKTTGSFGKNEIDPMSIRIAKAIEAGVKVPVQDIEDSQLLGYITKEGVRNALGKMAASNYKAVAGRIISEDYDAGDADAWFQYAVMGEVVYG
jgi:hypothetical protein